MNYPNIEKKHIIIIGIIIAVSLIGVFAYQTMIAPKIYEYHGMLIDVQIDNTDGSVIIFLKDSQITINRLSSYFGNLPLSEFKNIIINHVGKTIDIEYRFDNGICILESYTIKKL